MWHVLWHVAVGLALIVIGVPSAVVLFIMSIFTTDKGGMNGGTFAVWGIAALCAVAALFGFWLVIALFV